MIWLFDASTTGWREDSLKRTPKEKNAEMLARIIQGASQKTSPNKINQELLANALQGLNNQRFKRVKSGLRRSNPRCLIKLSARLKVLLVAEANRKNLRQKDIWVGKAQLAEKLAVPEHFITQILHRWNLAGFCSQGANDGPHDTHRASFFYGPWKSAWQDTRYTIFMAKLDSSAA